MAAYQNSFQGAFVWDDFAHIVDNPSIRHLWPLGGPLSGTARPVVALSLAVQYALGGLSPWGYHLFNVVIHGMAAGVLFSVIRRTLSLPRLPERCRSASTHLALSVSLLWAVHPLQTESVTYVIQRAESLMGLFFLLLLYSVIRRSNSGHPGRWRIAAVVFCALGMASKPTMIVAPMAVLLYEWVFFRRSFREILQQEKGLYGGLAATGLEWALLLVWAPKEHVSSAGFAWVGSSPLGYALTQPSVVLHYLKLAFWPYPLVLDYHWPIVQGGSASWVAPLLLVGGMGLFTVRALFQRREIGFLGAWFFLTLAPTSSVVPLADPAAEHRMYLPLAAVLAGVVLCGHRILSRWIPSSRFRKTVAFGLLMTVAAVLGKMTFRRNQTYFSEISIWADTAARQPDNPRAHNNLGKALQERGRIEQAAGCYLAALRLKPGYAAAHQNLGNILLEQQRWEEARFHLLEAVRLDPKSAPGLNDYGGGLARLGQIEKAIPWFEQAVALDPDYAQAHSNLGLLLGQQGRAQEALDHCRLAVRLKPDDASGHNNFGVVLFGQGRIRESADQFQEAARLRPDDAQFQRNLATALRALQNRPADKEPL